MKSAISCIRLGTAILLVSSLSSSLLAAPAEGTAGQTVTGRSLGRLDSGPRPGTLVAAAPTHSKPAWKDLSPAEQQALRPLASHWGRLTEERKRKWLVISKNYPSLSPAEQVKLHRRMSEWITLSQQQRNQARQNFSEIKKLSPEQKAAEWEAYQALSPEERRKLATQAPAKPALAVGKPGASPKLTSAPRRNPSPGARMAEINPPVQPPPLSNRQDSPSQEPERSLYDEAHTD